MQQRKPVTLAARAARGMSRDFSQCGGAPSILFIQVPIPGYLIYKVLSQTAYHSISAPSSALHAQQLTRTHLALYTVLRYRTLQNKVQTRQETRPDKQANPEDHVAQNHSALEQLCSAQTDQWHLQKLHREEIAAHLSKQASHDELMSARRDEESDESSRSFTDMESGNR